MIITCSECSTSFELDAGLVQPDGSKVRCSVCSNMFTVFPHGTGDAPVEPPVPDADTVADQDTETVNHEDAPVEEDLEFSGEDAPISNADADIPQDDVADTFEKEIEDNLDTLFDDEESFPKVADEPESDAFEEASPAIEEDLEISPEPDIEETLFVSSDSEDKDLALDVGADQALEDELQDDEITLDFDVELEDTEDGDAVKADALEIEEDGEPSIEPPPPPGEISDIDEDMDLSSLDLEFDDVPGDESDVKDEAPVLTPEESVETKDFDLDFDLESEMDDDQVKETAVDEEDLELSLDTDDLDLTFDTDDLELDDAPGVSAEDAKPAEIDFEDDILDNFDLEVDDKDGTADEDVEDLDFDLDFEFDDSEIGMDSNDDDLDLSDIAEMLERANSEDPDQALDTGDDSLDIEKSIDAEKWSSEPGADDMVDEEGEIDLNEIEQVLDDVDFEADDDKDFDKDLDLDFDDILDSALDDRKEGAAGDVEDIELSGFKDIAEPDEAPGEAVIEESDGLKLDFDVDESDEIEAEDNGLEETVAVPETMDIETADTSDEGPKARESAPPVKKSSSKFTVFLLIILILAGGLFGAYYFLDKSGIEIPYISQYLNPKVEESGTSNLTTLDINSKFVENTTEGKLFVITGKVSNGYSSSYSFISLTGKLFSVNKKITGNQTVYCGNFISDHDLVNLKMDAINKRLSNRLGDKRSNVVVKPGQSIPFMLVFSNLPDDLEEFTIEVATATPVKEKT